MLPQAESETMAPGSVGLNATKVVGALALAIGLIYYLVLPTVAVLARPRPLADGPRALIAVSTQGGTTDYALHAYMRGKVNEDIEISLLLYAVDGERALAETISLHVTFFGPRGRAGAVRCEDEDLTTNRWAELGEGARSAFLMDTGSTTAGAHPLGKNQDPPESKSFPQWLGDVSMVPVPGKHEWDGSALQCTIPANWVWSSVPRRTTGLLPQVNFNAITNTTDFQTDMRGDVSINRRSDWILSESYPAATLDGYYLTQELSHFWTGDRRTVGNLGYLTQPDLMFVQRFTGEDDAKILTLGGIAIGVAGSLVVSSLARLLDICAAVAAARKRNHSGHNDEYD